jgi:hypothetical protein
MIFAVDKVLMVLQKINCNIFNRTNCENLCGTKCGLEIWYIWSMGGIQNTGTIRH